MKNSNSEESRLFWKKFVDSSKKFQHLENFNFKAWSFGNSSTMANELGELVLEGKKTATCSLLRDYRGQESEIPQVGLYSLLLDGKNKPLCILFLTDTWICRYKDITQKHAYEEGEGERTLKYWREVHFSFFSSNGDFDETEELVCERFKVVFK